MRRIVALNSEGQPNARDAVSRTDGVAEEFVLAAPARGIFLGDEVRIDYRSDDRGRKIAFRVVELSGRQ